MGKGGGFRMVGFVCLRACLLMVGSVVGFVVVAFWLNLECSSVHNLNSELGIRCQRIFA